VRQRVLANMCFNLGISRLKGFVRMLSALRRKDFAAAAREMRSSKWAEQVGARAERLARLMEAG
jgi:lysozyme